MSALGGRHLFTVDAKEPLPRERLKLGLQLAVRRVDEPGGELIRLPLRAPPVAVFQRPAQPATVLAPLYLEETHTVVTCCNSWCYICGGDSFECVWNGSRHTVDWHIKNGTGTRDPRRCLRIYYFWDDDARSVVVASMPAHRRTAR